MFRLVANVARPRSWSLRWHEEHWGMTSSAVPPAPRDLMCDASEGAEALQVAQGMDWIQARRSWPPNWRSKRRWDRAGFRRRSGVFRAIWVRRSMQEAPVRNSSSCRGQGGRWCVARFRGRSVEGWSARQRRGRPSARTLGPGSSRGVRRRTLESAEHLRESQSDLS